MPEHMCGQIMEENHCGPMAGHFSGHEVFNILSHHWWWEGMDNDSQKYMNGFPECTLVSEAGKVQHPPLHSIPVSRSIQITGVDVMDHLDHIRQQACLGVPTSMSWCSCLGVHQMPHGLRYT